MRTLCVGHLSTSTSQSEGVSPVAMPRDNRLFTILLTVAACLHIVRLHICMLWLTKIMQEPAAARRALAVELLRRLDRTENRRCRSQSLSAQRPRFTAGSLESRRQKSITLRPLQPHQTNLSTTELQFRLPRRSLVGVVIDGFALEELAMNCLSNTSDLQDASTGTGETVQLFNSRAEHDQDTTSRAVDLTPPVSPKSITAPLEIDSLSQFDLGCTPPPSHHEASGSDTTSMERNGTPSPNAHTPTDPEDDTLGGAGESTRESPDQTLPNFTNGFYGPATPQYHRHRRYLSVESTSSTPFRKSATKTLRAQTKTNGGLFELRASASKTKDSTSTRAHRRNMSFDLPVQSTASHHRDTHQTQFQSPVPNEPRISVQATFELQYKYRHIFIGTASLHNFLKTLETSPRSTTKLAVMKAFTALAFKEQLLCRQSSSSPQDWNLVARVTPNTSEFTPVTLARVQLGSISLQQFVDRIPFDKRDEAPIAAIVEAFKNASLMDSQEDGDADYGAHAFRSWLLSHGSTAD